MAKPLWVGVGEFILKWCLYICTLHKTEDISQSWSLIRDVWESPYNCGFSFSKLVLMTMGKSIDFPPPPLLTISAKTQSRVDIKPEILLNWSLYHWKMEHCWYLEFTICTETIVSNNNNGLSNLNSICDSKMRMSSKILFRSIIVCFKLVVFFQHSVSLLKQWFPTGSDFP